jgi:RNA polymerase primary sigma factor
MKNTTKAHKQALEKVIMIGKEKGYLTYSELNDLLPKDLLTQDLPNSESSAANAATAASAEVDCALAPDSTTRVSASGIVSETTISNSSRMDCHNIY